MHPNRESSCFQKGVENHTKLIYTNLVGFYVLLWLLSSEKYALNLRFFVYRGSQARPGRHAAANLSAIDFSEGRPAKDDLPISRHRRMRQPDNTAEADRCLTTS